MRFIARLRPAVAALVVAAAGGLGVVAAAPTAAVSACPGVSGVTVVVESNGLGAGSAQSCIADGGGHTADRLLKEAGYRLDYVQRFPGFVCRIDGAPADDPCVNTPPADAYWGLWWSDGTTGRWLYSTLGAASLSLPAGGYVAMVWDGSAGTVAPAATPAVHPTPTPTPKPTPTRTPRPSPTHAPTTAPATTAATPTATATATATKKPKPPKPTRTRTPSGEPSTSATPTDQVTEAGGATDLPPSDPPGGDTDDGGVPGWVAPVLVALLLAAAAAVAVARRRS